MIIQLLDFGDMARVNEKFARSAEYAEPEYLRAAMLAVGLDMRLTEKAIFRSQGRRGGGSWARLKQETINRKGNSRILFTRGSFPKYSSIGNDALYESLTSMESPFHIFNIVGYELEFGTSRPNAWTHEVGYPPKNIPARPFLKFTIRDMNRWRKIVRDHLMRSWVGVHPRPPYGA